MNLKHKMALLCRPGGTSGLEPSSGADLNLIDAYLQQLLPALAKAAHGTPLKGGVADGHDQTNFPDGHSNKQHISC
jgi:hypothetical protein